MNKTIIAIPCDSSEKNLKFYDQFVKSLRKFHPDIEVRRFDNPNSSDKDFFYRAAPIIAKQLFDEGYDTIIKADCDQLVVGSLDELLNDTDEYDAGVVLNDPAYPIQVWDIGNQFGSHYFNNGLVILKSKDFVNHWHRLCFTPHFQRMQFREQDMLNVLCSDYFNYKIKLLEATKIYGECAKSLWIKAFVKEDKLYVPSSMGDKQVNILHWGGGSQDPSKGKYHLKFQPDVAKWIDELIT